MRPWLMGLFGLGLLSGTTGCAAGMYRASSDVHFDVDGGKEIDDADIGRAFAASPQMPNRVRAAYYVFDDGKAADVEKMLASVPNVASVYRIPNLLVTGKRRFDENPHASAQELSVKKLRLLSARAHADVLVVFDNGWRGGGINGLIVLNILLIPALFAPNLSNETESYAQAYIVDVRNGYLYGEVSADKKGGKDFVMVWAKSPREIADEQWPVLLSSVKVQLGEKLKATPIAPTAAGDASRADRAVR